MAIKADKTKPEGEEKVEQKERPEFDKAELMKILDQILFEGEYTEEVIIKNKIKVVFRTRTAEEVTSISKELDRMECNLISTLQEQRAMYNLSYSLLDYNGKDLRTSKPLPDRYKFIGQLPVFIVSAVADALSKFDRKVDAACNEQEDF